MLTEAFQVTFDCLTDVLGCFQACSALGNTSRQSRASCHKYSVLIWLQVNTILHYSNILPEQLGTNLCTACLLRV
jgi:hypothetical protein